MSVYGIVRLRGQQQELVTSYSKKPIPYYTQAHALKVAASWSRAAPVGWRYEVVPLPYVDYTVGLEEKLPKPPPR